MIWLAREANDNGRNALKFYSSPLSVLDIRRISRRVRNEVFRDEVGRQRQAPAAKSSNNKVPPADVCNAVSNSPTIMLNRRKAISKNMEQTLILYPWGQAGRESTLECTPSGSSYGDERIGR